MSLISNRRKILIVDDAPAVAESLALILSREGFDVKVAHSAEEAMDLVPSWEPDGAFVDIMLPGMNGIDFSNSLRVLYPNCWTELMSGHPGTSELIDLAKREGKSLEVLSKPFDPPQLISIAHNHGAPQSGNGTA